MSTKKLPQATAYRRTLSHERLAWDTMRWRCDANAGKNYKYYKGKGITVCERWLKFENFLEDMGPKPFPKATLERLDNSKGYEPGNCIWADYFTQNNNRSFNRVFEYKGEKKTAAQLARMAGISDVTFGWRVKHGWPLEEIMTTPAKLGNKWRKHLRVKNAESANAY